MVDKNRKIAPEGMIARLKFGKQERKKNTLTHNTHSHLYEHTCLHSNFFRLHIFSEAVRLWHQKPSRYVPVSNYRDLVTSITTHVRMSLR